jgi:hypothetical protein
MNAAEIKQILSSGKAELFEIDPQFKTEITRATIAAMDRTIKKSISSKRAVKIVIVS